MVEIICTAISFVSAVVITAMKIRGDNRGKKIDNLISKRSKAFEECQQMQIENDVHVMKIIQANKELVGAIIHILEEHQLESLELRRALKHMNYTMDEYEAFRSKMISIQLNKKTLKGDDNNE